MPDWTLKGMTVLVVEDFAEMRTILREMLFSLGSREIREAKSGEQAMTILESEPIDLVICDFNLGRGKDGQQVLEEARHRGFLLYSSIFAMISADSTAKVVMSVVEHEPDDYLTKPVTVSVMRKRLCRMMERKQGMREISEVVQRGDYPKALQMCDERLAVADTSRIELLKLKAFLLLKIERYTDAQAIYQQILAVEELPWALLGYGKTLYFQERYQEARPVFERVMELKPTMVIAYDWLARTLDKLGDTVMAQRIVAQAIEQSPRTLQRQRLLAEFAAKNRDDEVARTAYMQSVTLGKHSVFRSPSDYIGLAQVYIRLGDTKEALRVMSQMRREFIGNPNWIIQRALAQHDVHKQLEQRQESEEALQEAIAAFTKEPAVISSASSMQLAKVCLEEGRIEEAKELLRHVVQNNHENEALLAEVAQLFQKAGLGTEGRELIARTRSEVVNLNNRGVELIREGKLEESITRFLRAANAMPENVAVNLNAAQSLIMSMQQAGRVNLERYDAARRFLKRVGAADPGNEKYHKLVAALHRLR